MYNLSKDPFESTYDDFMELWLQFGHVFLFSSVYPLASFFALVNCLLSLKIDAWKLCKLMRKPTPRGVRDIGAWSMAFSVTSVISVMTNLTLLSLDKDVQAFAPEWSSRDWILMFVFFEHVLLLIRVIIEISISDVPKKVKMAMDKNDFLLRQQWFNKGCSYFKNVWMVPGNALAWVQLVHEALYLWEITFSTRRFWGSKYYLHPRILRPRALFYRIDCTRRSKFLTHALNIAL